MNLHDACGVLERLAQLVPPTGEVRLTFDGPVATLTLDHPGARNALSASMMAEMARHVATLLTWDGALVVLKGAGRSFCSGGHLADVEAALLDPAAAGWMCAGMAAVLDALHTAPFVSVAHLEGSAVGGGVELALAADFRWMAPESWMELRQVRLGVAAGWGGAPRLVELVGRRTALELLTTGRRVDVGEALTLGLADGQGEEPAAWLGRWTELPVSAVRACKRQIVDLRPSAQADAFLSVWGAAPHRERLAAARRRS